MKCEKNGHALTKDSLLSLRMESLDHHNLKSDGNQKITTILIYCVHY